MMHAVVSPFGQVKKLALVIGLLACTVWSSAQTVSIIPGKNKLSEVFNAIEQQSELRVVLSEEDVNLQQTVTLPKSEYTLSDLLLEVSTASGVEFTRIENVIIAVQPAAVEKNKSAAAFNQLIKGVVTDAGTGETLPIANVFVEQYPGISTVTDVNGRFVIEAPVGRMNLSVSYIGYQTEHVSLLINTGQEPFLNIALTASVSSLKEVVVQGEREKAKTLNEMVYASGRGFTVMEANRYAGTLGDPARMARSFAGVIPARDDRNDIIIRGNSPTGLQWRLEGIEIPNPSHFGGIGLTGNTITLLNINLLDDSDFLMGAFPSEYGNALAGVFDLRMKKVNPEKRQYRFQTGWNGFEFGAEGPFSKKKNVGTYSLTYRYSFLDVMDEVGIDYGVLPEFQDLTGKVDLPLGKKTNLSLIGIWGISYIELDDRETRDSSDVSTTGQYLRTGSDLSLGGANLTHRFNDQWSMKAGISVIHNKVNTTIDTFNFASDATSAVYGERSTEVKYAGYTEFNHRKGRNHVRTGIRWDTYDIRYNQQSVNNQLNVFDTIKQSQDQMHLVRIYAEDEFRFTDRLRARAGLHGQYLFLNGSQAIEPRLGVRYLLADRHALAFTYGNHHQVQPRPVYFVETETANGGTELTNRNLDFSGAHHLVGAYDVFINEHMRLKTEAYYQHLYDIPVIDDPNNTFSMLNVGADFYIPQHDSLVNEGLGRNYGLEMTLERFLFKGYYFMLNGTAYRSEYQALDKKWRSTAFDLRYVMNAMAGYEHWFSKKIALGFDAKLTYAGGKPYTPVMEALSRAKGEVVFDESEAYAERYRDYFRTDVKIYYRINYKRFYTEFAMDLQNLTNSKNIFQREYVPETGEYRTYYQMAFFPMFTFKCLF